MRAVVSRIVVAAMLLAVPAAAATDAPRQDLHFDSSGVRIRYTVQGVGEPVLLVHGFTGSVEKSWEGRGIIDALASDYQVIALDARGHGRSGKPHDPEAYGFHMVDDVIRLMDHLGILRAHIAGYSMGGGIVLRAAIHFPDRFYCAILGGAGWRPPESGRDDRMITLAESLEQGGGLGPLLLALNPVGQPLPDAEAVAARNARMMVDNDPLALAAVIRGGAGNRRISADQLRANRVPMLAVVGEVDPIRSGVDAMAEHASHLEVVVLGGKDHRTASIDPELVARMREFLSRH